MGKRTEINDALKAAMKKKDSISVSTIRLIMAAIKERDIMARSQGHAEGISDKEILSLLQSMIKQRRESSQTYKDAGRPELAEREEQEIEVINQFLPRQMSEDELKTTVESLINDLGVSDIKDMGREMAELKSRYAGQIDMSKASGIVKEKLAA